MHISKLFIGLLFCLVGNNVIAQIEYVAVCNSTTEKVEILKIQDTLGGNFRLLKNKLPNKMVALRWVEKNHPDGRCAANAPKQVIRPNIPSNAGQKKPEDISSNSPETPKKKVSHLYKSYRLFSYGTTNFNLSQLPTFEVNSTGGQFFGFRFQKGGKVHIGFTAEYLIYGKVASFEDGANSPPTEKNWSAGNLSWFGCYPVELHKKSGKIWFLPQAGIGFTAQNLANVENQDFEINLNDKATFFYEIKAGFEFYNIHLAISYQKMLSNTFENNPEFKFRGVVLSAGIAF